MTPKLWGTCQAAEERGVAAGHAEAEAITQSLQARLTELETLLASMLSSDPYLPFDRLKEPEPQARFQPPPELAEPTRAPELDAPVPPSGLGALAPNAARHRLFLLPVKQICPGLRSIFLDKRFIAYVGPVPLRVFGI